MKTNNTPGSNYKKEKKKRKKSLRTKYQDMFNKDGKETGPCRAILKTKAEESSSLDFFHSFLNCVPTAVCQLQPSPEKGRSSHKTLKNTFRCV